jgi:BlaI family transcriptional regulator, penicillinase repressor
MKRDLESIILTRQELEIMKVIWDRGAAKVGEVCEIISNKKPTAYTTILTLMGILEDKGALSHARSGRAYVYKPLLSRQQATRNQIQDVMMRFFDGRAEKLLESLLQCDLAQAEQLEAAVSHARNKNEGEVQVA